MGLYTWISHYQVYKVVKKNPRWKKYKILVVFSREFKIGIAFNYGTAFNPATFNPVTVFN